MGSHREYPAGLTGKTRGASDAMGRADGLPDCQGSGFSFSYVTPELAVQAESFFFPWMKCRSLERMQRTVWLWHWLLVKHGV